MQPRLRQSVLCTKDVQPSSDEFEVVGAFNPGAVQTDEGTVLLVRIAERPCSVRPGFTGSPRWIAGQGMTIDWISNDDLEIVDPRVVRFKSNDLTRLTFTSYLKVFRSRDGVSFIGDAGAAFVPENQWEEFGVEDPRITPLDGRFYFTYVAVSRHGVATALASTQDFRSFTRHGLIFGPENKDVVLFPEKIDGQYVALHRPSGGAGFARPGMWLACSPDLVHWGQHRHLQGVGSEWEYRRIGAGPPPLRIAEGWLVIYHGCGRPQHADDVGAYSAGALLLAHDDPGRILRKSALPFLVPELHFEVDGFVPNVVFPTGLVAERRSLLIYYGAADTSTAVVRTPVDEILDSMSAT